MEKTNIKVYFLVEADDFSVEDFTNELGIKPTRAYRKGDAVKRPSNPNMMFIGTHYRLHTSWQYR